MKIILAVGALSFSLSTCGRGTPEQTPHEHFHQHTHVHDHTHPDGTAHGHLHEHWHSHPHQHDTLGHHHTQAELEQGADHHSAR